jgi:hypothetical protein
MRNIVSSVYADAWCIRVFHSSISINLKQVRILSKAADKLYPVA